MDDADCKTSRARIDFWLIHAWRGREHCNLDCSTLPWFALLCPALPCFALLCPALPYFALLYFDWSPMRPVTYFYLLVSGPDELIVINPACVWVCQCVIHGRSSFGCPFITWGGILRSNDKCPIQCHDTIADVSSSVLFPVLIVSVPSNILPIRPLKTWKKKKPGKTWNKIRAAEFVRIGRARSCWKNGKQQRNGIISFFFFFELISAEAIAFSLIGWRWNVAHNEKDPLSRSVPHYSRII